MAAGQFTDHACYNQLSPAGPVVSLILIRSYGGIDINGTTISKHLHTSAALDFGSIGGQSAATPTMAVQGAAVGDGATVRLSVLPPPGSSTRPWSPPRTPRRSGPPVSPGQRSVRRTRSSG